MNDYTKSYCLSLLFDGITIYSNTEKSCNLLVRSFPLLIAKNSYFLLLIITMSLSKGSIPVLYFTFSVQNFIDLNLYDFACDFNLPLANIILFFENLS